jgi:carbon monoxide dehydrogenase subunit G
MSVREASAMARIRVRRTIDAPPGAVWEELRHIERHVDWMADAEAIERTSTAREGEGVTFTCRTRVGPFRLRDHMTTTEWVDGWVMGVRHDGIVSGSGRFTLRARRHGHTRLTWDERLRFPWWMGGRAGALVARPVLRAIWRGNLRRLAEIVEHPR